MPSSLKDGSSLQSVKNVTAFGLNPKGIVKVKFLSSAQASWCIKKMDGRFFDGRKLRCFYWDGKTDYRLADETKEEAEKRIAEFGDWLEKSKQS